MKSFAGPPSRAPLRTKCYPVFLQVRAEPKKTDDAGSDRRLYQCRCGLQAYRSRDARWRPSRPDLWDRPFGKSATLSISSKIESGRLARANCIVRVVCALWRGVIRPCPWPLLWLAFMGMPIRITPSHESAGDGFARLPLISRSSIALPA